MAVNQPPGIGTAYLLPCGRDVEGLWERLDRPGPPGDHLDCPHCAATVASLLVLREVTEELAADRAEPSARMTDRIMSAVRAELRRGDLVPLSHNDTDPATDSIRLSAQAAAAVFRFAADGVAGVRARRCRVSTLAGDPDSAWLVRLEVAVSYPSFTPAALDVVRERVISAAAGRIGVRLGRLDVTVTDVLDDTEGRS